MNFSHKKITLNYRNFFFKIFILYIFLINIAFSEDTKIGSITEINGEVISITEEGDERILDVYDKNYIQVHATSPLVKSKTIDKAIKFYLQNKNYDSLFSVTKIKKRFWNSKNKPYNHNLSEAPTTQALKELFEENSGFYIFNKNTFKKKLNRIGYRPKLFEISKLEGFDIDDNQDFKIVEKLLS